ncbi:flavin-containing amine oxidoreductase-domain containing protein [Chaetomium sp. MPI-SDFR-AT-0129]|nr:flavin-containing amine oxidoreductase-domain containing protein [Chaetomium sp. MPI-SDFR-AT-0129]
MMGSPSKSRTRYLNGSKKGLLSSPKTTRDIDSRRSTRISLACPIKPPSPPASTASDPESTNTTKRAVPKEVLNSSEDIAPEIVVWTEDMDNMAVDTPESTSPTVSSEQEQAMTNKSPVPGPHPPQTLSSSIPQKTSSQQRDSSPLSSLPSVSDHFEPAPVSHAPPPPATTSSMVHNGTSVKESSSLSSLSSFPLTDHSDFTSLAQSGSSKATTPIDVDSSREAPADDIVPPKPLIETPRRKWDVRPKVSIPPDLPLSEYAMQCVAAADASRLNPYSLHQGEYLMMRDHISHTQVTTYLNVRNGILRLWVRNPQIPVTREEAVGCAKDPRWFDVASVCFDWLVRHGYINFGCVEVRPSRKHGKQYGVSEGKRKTVVVIGAGMSGLGCARQLEGLFQHYTKKFRVLGEEPPRVIILEGRDRIGGRVYSRAFKSQPKQTPGGFEGKRYTAEMGGMIITGFERGNPLNVLIRGQLGLGYHFLRPETTLYDSSGKPVDLNRDQLVENLYNDCLDRVSEYKFKQPTSKLIEGNRDLIDEGKDSSAETHKTIRQTEESAAAQPYAAPVSEQNIAPQVNLVPVSTDRATGKIHTEPGTPGALKAAHKAKMIGWTLKQGVSDDADLNIEAATMEPGATLGSVTDNVISQYRDLLDLTAQDFRLMNWHIANLEYSNATNYHQLSLQGWDIDAGNEWEGSHSMVVGGYQSVPRGLMHLPTPLDVRQKSPVNKITYTANSTTGPATVSCEDGSTIEADFVVSTIPLGVLKHGNVKFEPPLPSWKSDAVERLGFGVLNKVILVYKEPFWDEDRDIFGVLRNPTNRHSLEQKDYAPQRGRFFQWFNVTRTSGLPVLIALMAGDAGFDTEQTCNDDLVAEATHILHSVYGSRVPNPVEAVVTRWASDKFARGSYSSAGPSMAADDYDTMARPIGNLFFAGEHTSGTHPATVHGAYLSGLRAASEVVNAMLGPIPVPTPLILPKDYASSTLLGKRKASSLEGTSPFTAAITKDPARARLEAYETRVWEHITSQLGSRPLPPTKPATNAYIFYSRTHYEDARERLEAGRRPGKGKPSANEVRVMSAKMWRDAPEAEKKPYLDMAEEQKKIFVEALEEFREKAAEWDEKAAVVKEKWTRENPLEGGTPSGVAIGGGVRDTATPTPAGTDPVDGDESQPKVEGNDEEVDADVDGHDEEKAEAESQGNHQHESQPEDGAEAEATGEINSDGGKMEVDMEVDLNEDETKAENAGDAMEE